MLRLIFSIGLLKNTQGFESQNFKQTFFQAINVYLSKMTWKRLLFNLIDPSLNDIMEKQQNENREEPFTLDSDANWNNAVMSTLARQRSVFILLTVQC